jgi:hypothetical protein
MVTFAAHQRLPLMEPIAAALWCSRVFRSVGLRDGGQLLSIPRHPVESITHLRGQHIHHESLGRDVPFTGQPIPDRWPKTEARVELRMSDDHDKWAARAAQPFDADLHQATTNAVSLVTRRDGQGGQPSALNGSDKQGAEHDVPDDDGVIDGHERECRRAIRSKRIHDPGFIVLSKGEPVDLSNGGYVARSLVPDIDHVDSRWSAEHL